VWETLLTSEIFFYVNHDYLGILIPQKYLEKAEAIEL
jgi:hypothetical protein